MCPRALSVERLFCQAIAIASPTLRQAFLDEACAGAPALKYKVARLVEAHFKAGHFLDIQNPLEHRRWSRSLDDPATAYVCELFTEILLKRPELDEAKQQLAAAFRMLNASSLTPHQRWLKLLKELIAMCDEDEAASAAALHQPR